MSTPGTTLTRHLLDAARSLGAERAVDIVLNVLFARWMTLSTTDPAVGGEAWRKVTAGSSPAEVAREFAGLAIFYDDSDHEGSRTQADPGSRRDLLAAAEMVLRLETSLPQSDDEARAVLAEGYEEALDELGRLGKQAGEADTPAVVAELLAALTVRPGDEVLDPACGNGSALVAAARQEPSVHVSGFEINARTRSRAIMRMHIHGARTGFGIAPGDAFLEYEPGGADVVLVQPPWGGTLVPAQEDVAWSLARKWGSEQNRRPSSDVAWLLLAMDAMRQGRGRAAVLLPAWRHGSTHLAAVAPLLRRGVVEAVVALPPGLFAHTGIATVLWVLRASGGLKPDRTLMIDATSLVRRVGTKGVALNSDAVQIIRSLIEAHRKQEAHDHPPHLARTVSLEELLSRRDFDPRVYLEPPPEEPVVHPVPERTLLTEIVLTNFKAFGPPSSAPLAPLTLVYGPNSAGKSSLIQALLLLKQSRGATQLRTQGPLVNVGAFRGVVHGHRDHEIQISLRYGALPHWLATGGGPDPSMPRSLRWTFAGDASGQGVPVGAEVSFGEYSMRFSRGPDHADPFTLDRADTARIFEGLASGTLYYPFEERRASSGVTASDEQSQRTQRQNVQRALRGLQRVDSEPLSVRPTGLLPSAEIAGRLPVGATTDREAWFARFFATRAGALAGAVATEVDRLLEELVWLGPLRSAPQRVYDRATSSGTSGGGADVAIFLLDHASVVDQVNDWLTRLEIPYTLQVVPIAGAEAAHMVGDLVAISLTDNRTGVTVTPADVGYGISQLLPIVVELLAHRDCVIAIEQPETHLHPRLQARLADLFIDSTQAGGRDNQLIVETHSEHLMLRVQRRIREGALDPESVSVVYVDRAPDGPASIRQLRLNDHGEFLDEWPGGFFDDRLSDLFSGL